jgi:hypothetical protein
MSYPYELVRWRKAGYPVRSPERIEELFDTVCLPCKYYIPITDIRGKCGLCGCGLNRLPGSHFNKLEWATCRCPAKPPKFIEELK